jgi:hypothetical protein
MKAVETLFGAGELRLTADIAQVRAAVANRATGAWSADATAALPRWLPEFLPTSEGGHDSTPAGRRRVDAYAAGLAPWEVFPRELATLPGAVANPLQRLFYAVGASDQRPGLAEMIRQRQTVAEMARSLKGQEKEFPQGQMQDDIVRGVMASFRSGGDEQGPTLRQLVLRGQYDEATAAMVGLADQLRALRNRGDIAQAASHVAPWADKVRAAYADLLRANRGNDAGAAATAGERLETLGRDARPIEAYVQWLAAGPALARLEFLTAVAKHDQAEARRAKADAKTWTTAVGAWRSFVANHPDAPQTALAYRMLGSALSHAGQGAAAAEAYRLSASKATGPRKTAAEYLASTAAR